MAKYNIITILALDKNSSVLTKVIFSLEHYENKEFSVISKAIEKLYSEINSKYFEQVFEIKMQQDFIREL